MARKAASNPNYQPTYNAPTLIIVSCKKNGTSDFGREYCAAATENMLIAAESMNIASVWLGIVESLIKQEEESSKFGIPEGYKPYYAVAFGYKAKKTEQIAPKRNMDVINYIR